MDASQNTDRKVIQSNVYKTAQENLVASLFRLPNRIVDVISMIDEDDFEDPSCKLIFIAMRNIAINGHSQDIEIDTLQIELEREGNLVAAGGQQRLVQLLEKSWNAAASNTIDAYARIVKDISTKRRMNTVLSEVRSNLTIDSGSSARQTIEETQNELTDLMGGLETSKMASSIKEYYGTFVDKLKERAKTYRETGDELKAARGIPTGFPTLDAKLHGWQNSNMIFLAARTGVGKSVSAVDFGLAAAKAGASVLFFSMEMSIEEIFQRFVACMTGVSINSLSSGNIKDSQIESIEQAKNEFERLKIEIDTTQHSTIERIRSTAQRKAQSEEGLDLVIIDYLELIEYSGKRFAGDRQNQIASISRSIKEMAMTLDIPVIVLGQLENRSRGEEAEVEPTLAYIRGSGGIANDSNVIILLHRKKDENKNPSEIPTKFIIEKNRGGEKGSFLCHSFLWKAKFEEFDEEGSSDFNDDSIAEGNAAAEASEPSEGVLDGTSDVSSVDFGDEGSAGIPEDDFSKLFGEVDE